jgi:eukaryotic-like serine/threonine-protein kinase
MLLEGQQCSHYRLIKLLKHGGMGEVYHGEDTRLNRQVAIKVIYTDAATVPDPKAARDVVNLFLREARVIAQLDHIHILPLYDSGEDIISGTKVMYMVMPLRHEGSFADWWYEHARKGPLPLPAVERVVRQAAEALQHTHDRHIIHKDVKPSNFLVRGRAEHPSQLDLQLADFGIARIALVTSESQSIRGTPSYMAPEQWSGDPVPATDQYALAVMAYELLTGHTPFEGKEYQQLWHQHNYMRPARPSSIYPGIPREIDEVLLRALEKDPKRRFSSISAFAHAFQRAVIDSGNIQLTVRVSPFEAHVGTVRLLPLNDGREVTVPVPAGAYQGQILRLEGNGHPTTYDGPRGALILTIAIHEEIAPARYANYIEPTVPVFPATVEAILPAPPAHLPLLQRPARRSSGALKIGLYLIFLLLLSGSLFGMLPKFMPLVATPPATPPPPTRFTVNGPLVFDDQLTDGSSDLWVKATPPQYGNCMSLPEGLDASVGATATNGISSKDVPSDIKFHSCIKKDMAQPFSYVYSDFAYEVNMTINKGDCGGVAFRVKDQQTYYFVICENGIYSLVGYLGNSEGSVTLIADSSPGIDPNPIHMGLGVSNTIAVEARGKHIDLYVNGTKIDSKEDSMYLSGYIGVIAKSLQPAVNDPTDVVFTNARMWKLTA